MAKKKLIHFTENLSFPHLFQPRYAELQPSFRFQGKWGSDFFRNDHPITLELGCGKGEYTVGLARQFPTRNFIGIDVKGARLWRGCKTVEEDHLLNVAFIRSLADHIEYLFQPGEVGEIWITFPEPQPGKERKRLTAPVFLNRYHRILQPNGLVHLKTDDQDLFRYTKEILKEHPVELLLETEDLYHEYKHEPAAKIQTFYESIWLEREKKIAYLRFRFINT
ncbi:MAG: tRNA (guanosine(46)-N7)-methyltransferase TrmB [Bacteroidales bacterium]|nr:tRNA (guanosine(46)-N7)-methyltransferase TrmB [Bacteroidales bacterium]